MSNYDPSEWITTNLRPREGNSGSFLYGHVESWTNGGLPGIHVPFDGTIKTHFVNRAQELDFVSVVGHGRILDIGPGDGWPSLGIAPMVASVVGVEASPKRVHVCQENARLALIENASFLLVPPGEPLPFADGSIDGVVASWSLEESPCLGSTLAEICRVLRPGGKLRFERIPLGFIPGGAGTLIRETPERRTLMVVGKAVVEREQIVSNGLLVDLPHEEVDTIFRQNGLAPGSWSQAVLRDLSPHINDAATWTTLHPGSRSWLDWLSKAGFSSAKTTYSGWWVGERLFDRLPEHCRPRSLDETDKLLLPVIEVVVNMDAPLEMDLPIVATK